MSTYVIVVLAVTAWILLATGLGSLIGKFIGHQFRYTKEGI